MNGSRIPETRRAKVRPRTPEEIQATLIGESTPGANATNAILDAILDVLAERVAEKVALRVSAGKPRYADGRNNPFDSERAFLEAARRGDFETFLVSRRVTALWSDVERYIESRTRPARPAPLDAGDPDAEELIDAGVRLRPAKGSRR